jgi:hypothetical protein
MANETEPVSDAEFDKIMAGLKRFRELWKHVSDRDVFDAGVKWARAHPLPTPSGELEALRLLGELHALVKGECRSLLDEDSGGDARLDLDIRAALAAQGQQIGEERES